MSARASNTPEIDWEQLDIRSEDLEFLSAYLLEVETPLSPEELAAQLVRHRIELHGEELERQQAVTKPYLPKEHYQVGDQITFPTEDWLIGRVEAVRPAMVIDSAPYEVLQVAFENGESREYAASLDEHVLNIPPEVEQISEDDADALVQARAKEIAPKLVAAMANSPEFIYIAGRWFPRALMIDVGEGQLNVAEALLDMASGGPLPTEQLLGEVELSDSNIKLAGFSLDHALQEDERFDEVGPSGKVAWFLRRLEPEAVREIPLYLRYHPIEHDRSALTQDMLDLERRLDDDLTPAEFQPEATNENIQIPLIFPHWRVGSLPLTQHLARLFPTAYESPRVLFDFVDAESGDRFQGWVEREHGYIVGLRNWYLSRNVMPGSFVQVKPGENTGEVLVSTQAHRSSKEWVRTALIGADGGVVYAMLKQPVETSFDERMVICLPGELQSLEEVWAKRGGKPIDNFAQIVERTMRELTKVNPQNHVHAVELYSAVNLVLRCPPGPLFALLASRPQFQHVGDLHFRLQEQIA